MNTKSYRDLKTWQEGMQLAESCYVLTRQFPKEELFGLTSQIRRVATSVPANIAEGWGRGSTKEYIQFLRISQGSLKEVETHLLLCERVKLAKTTDIEPLLQASEIIGKMIRATLRTLQSKITSPSNSPSR